MYNEIYLKDERKIVKKEKIGRHVKWFFDDDSYMFSTELKKERVNVKCKTCSSLINVIFYLGLLSKEYECYSCQRSGERNPFYGKQHSNESKIKMSKNTNHIGSNNPFYGKTHTSGTCKEISKKLKGKFSGERNPFYGKIHLKETRKRISKANKEYAKTHKDDISERAIKSLLKKKYKKTIPERIVEEQLQKRGLKYSYNKIIKNVGQFDFIIGNVLLEVNGDYWHGNPTFYGKNKKPLNERQQYKIKRDVIKKEKAEMLGFKVLYIWEDDIKQGNFGVLNEI